MSATKKRLFAHKNEAGAEPKVVAFYDDWTMDKLLDKATSKLDPDIPCTRMFELHGLEVHSVGDIKSDSKIYFSSGEVYNGPARPAKREEAASTEDAQAQTGATESGDAEGEKKPGLFARIFNNKKKPGAGGEDEKEEGDGAPEQSQEGVDESANPDSSAPGGVVVHPTEAVETKAKPPNFLGKLFQVAARVGEAANEALQERKDKIQEVLHRAQVAMDEVKEKTERAAERAAEAAEAPPSPLADSKEAVPKEILEPGVPLLALEVCVMEGRGMAAAERPYVIVTVEGVSKQTAEGKGACPSWREGSGRSGDSPAMRFAVSDPTGDIRLAVCDPTCNRKDRKLGRVIIPTQWLRASVMGVPYKWQSTFDAWLKVLPLPNTAGIADILSQQIGGVQAKSNVEAEERKFFPAVPKEKGSGLPKPEYPLGELRVKVKVHPSSDVKDLAGSYVHPARSGATIVRWKEVDADVDEFLKDDEDTKVLSLEGVNRVIHRIKLLLKGPPLLMQPPYSLATIIWLYVACFRSSASKVPWLLWSLLAMQGLALAITRSYKDIIVWDADIVKQKSKTVFEYGALIRKILRILGAYQYKADLIVTFLERFKNVLSGGDPFATALLFSVLAAFCALAQTIISILPSGSPWFLIGLSILSPPYIKIYNRCMRKEKKKKPDWIDKLRMTALTLAENFFNHIPDQNELAHRYICDMQRVKKANKLETKMPESKVPKSERSEEKNGGSVSDKKFGVANDSVGEATSEMDGSADAEVNEEI
eukprot:CAMPEP_0114504492 /NCGR_PEP_ID=MMETSP0109-20121206/10256_1 /TAXON_ID=29199 /ORGANISM="Chlorarachnion reptans, Strain CCCM449" /LENGTH=762 /DNA_ID=CAMNT_0001682683 /DNA_START=61 /DNA_END=2349 /DNA_ORIENTATION=-